MGTFFCVVDFMLSSFVVLNFNQIPCRYDEPNKQRKDKDPIAADAD